MADLFANILGGAKPGEAPAIKRDSDFADFAGAPNDAPEAAAAAAAPLSGAASPMKWTKWYNIHERHSLSEFKAEGIIFIFSAVVILLHIVGARANRAKARKWITAHAGMLKGEFASVGFGGVPTRDSEFDAGAFLREKSLFEYASYATGRQNVAFMDVKLTLHKRFNPALRYAETALSFLADSFAAPEEVLEATIYPFDGKEELTVPPMPGAAERSGRDARSGFDGFVWAVVNKDSMQRLRNDRYDLSLTATKDHARLPDWLTVMSESAEITQTFLTAELVGAVEAAGPAFEYLIISDQPLERPASIEETAPRKRLFLKYRLPAGDDYEVLMPLFRVFLGLPDALVQSAHFRPEVLKRVRATREHMVAQIKKQAEEEKSEERALEKERAKKAKRDAELKGLDAKAQKRYLEKEKEKELRRSQRRSVMRG
ncbi:UPF0674 endoplasmic reticulum membrane protein [Escovopsis weberi]|uniref:UPF0674 endoplasmic reticulum membrane protein n=1 Tax=Escovopsis weberi TaxID=150374 RepID=A0A0M8MRL0_ESCWE|nr:UPF0674 endoplasmic reticulum membrane protein [Escovopsis weberi]